MAIRVFKSPLFDTYVKDSDLRKDLQTLFADFKSYLVKGSQSEFGFGRDSKYDHSGSPQWLRDSPLRHVHVLPLEDFLRLVKVEHRQKYNITSEMHVIYSNFNYSGGDRYVLAIAAVYPNAHAFASSHKDGLRKCIDIAEKFESHVISLNRKPVMAAYLNPNHITAGDNRIKTAIIRAMLPLVFPHHHLFKES